MCSKSNFTCFGVATLLLANVTVEDAVTLNFILPVCLEQECGFLTGNRVEFIIFVSAGYTPGGCPGQLLPVLLQPTIAKIPAPRFDRAVAKAFSA